MIYEYIYADEILSPYNPPRYRITHKKDPFTEDIRASPIVLTCVQFKSNHKTSLADNMRFRSHVHASDSTPTLATEALQQCIHSLDRSIHSRAQWKHRQKHRVV